MYATRCTPLIALLLACIFSSSEAFLASPTRPRSSELHIGNIFGSLFGQEKQTKANDGPKMVIDMPATSVKVGPLKFFLQIYLVGSTNNPVKGAWVLTTNDENGALQMYYKDGTGMFALGLNENSINVQRFGERPSLEYILQESVMLHGVLDEINQIAFEVEDIEEEKRLLRFADDDAISKARENLPARKAEA
jgi:hypothetical protein